MFERRCRQYDRTSQHEPIMTIRRIKTGQPRFMRISYLVDLQQFHFLACCRNISPIGFRNPGSGELKPAERKFAINYLNKTKARLLNDVKGLSKTQFNFRANDSSWSVAQCVEHIALSENLIKQWVHGALLDPATPERKSEEKYTPETLIVIVTDRSQNRAKTGGPWLPDGNFPDGLKNHFIEHPQWGTLDLYQAFIMLSAHCERHTLQLEEVIANPNFPKQ